MKEILDAEYKITEALEDKATEVLVGEVNQIHTQLEMIGAFGCQLMAQGGKMLMVIKERIGHGNWEAWIKENLDFSPRKANYMMDFAKKISEENGLFSNPQTFADLKISTVYKILSAPEDVAEELVENPDLPDMTVKELEAEIKRLKEEVKNADYYREKAVNLEIKLQEAKESTDEEAVNKLLDKLNKAHEKARTAALREEKAKKALEEAEKQAEEKAAQAVEMALKEKEKEQDEKVKAATADKDGKIAALEAELEKMKKAGNAEVSLFKVKSTELQTDFNSCIESIEKIKESDQELSDKLRAALKNVMEQLTGRI